MNLVKMLFTVIPVLLAIIGALIYFRKNHLPHFLIQAFCYGKFAEKSQNPLINVLEIPKRWFQHFYIFAVPLSIFALFLSVNKYIYKKDIPSYVLFILDIFLGTDRKPLVSPAHTLLALVLVSIHFSKRLYESQSVNVYSDAKMNIAHYLLALLHYFCVVIVNIGESEGFVKGSEATLQNTLEIKDWFGTLLFLWMTYQQLKSNIILSNLRKNKKGVVVTKEYKMPQGGLFDYISAPLEFTEIGVYGALQIILCESSTNIFMYFWVVTNQFLSALFSHEWNKRTFKDYPESRKMIIPFLL